MKTITLIFCILTSACFSIPIGFSKNYSTFTADIKSKSVRQHRSTKPDSALTLAFLLSSIAIPDSLNDMDGDLNSWCSGALRDEYKVIPNNDYGFLKRHFAKMLLDKENLSEVILDSTDHAIHFKRPMDSALINDTLAMNLDTAALESIAQGKAAKYLGIFKNKIERQNNEVVYKNHKISEYHLRFRRLFLGGIVRYNLSYVYVNLMGDGTLKEIEVKWPRFVGLGKKETPIEPDSILAQASNYFTNIPKIVGKKDTLAALSGEISGMAFAWDYVEEGGDVLLTPCYSFIGVVQYEQGQKMYPIMDIPMIHKRWAQ
jgi:hypothetical protein